MEDKGFSFPSLLGSTLNGKEKGGDDSKSAFLHYGSCLGEGTPTAFNMFYSNRAALN